MLVHEYATLYNDKAKLCQNLEQEITKRACTGKSICLTNNNNDIGEKNMDNDMLINNP